MSKATFIFHGRLNDFLERGQREHPVTVEFKGKQSVKHLAESLGVPHPEIGEVQVNGQKEALDVIQQVPHPQYLNLIFDYEELIEFKREGVDEFHRKVDGKVIKVNICEMLNSVECKF